MSYSDFQRQLLATYFSVVDGPDHADIYLVHNLPAEVAATLNGVYSRSSKSMRDQFLDRLRQGLESQGKKLEDLPLPSANKDELSAVMADSGSPAPSCTPMSSSDLPAAARPFSSRSRNWSRIDLLLRE